jgi:hypothetical protein
MWAGRRVTAGPPRTTDPPSDGAIMTDPTPAGNGGSGLLPAHLDDLARSGLTAAHAAAAGLYSEPDPAAVAALLNWTGSADALGPCLVFPYLDPDGRPTGYARVKPATPRADKKTPGKVIKYEAPKGRPNRAFVPPGTRAALADPAARLLLTEGEKKGLAADAAGFPCLALPGVWAWQAKRPRDAAGKGIGPRRLIPDLAAVAWEGRPVVVAFDSDAADNPLVLAAERALVAALTAAGAAARAVRLPADPGGAKRGLDDFLAAEGPAALAALLDAPPPAGPPPKPDKPPSAADLLAGIGLGFDLWHDPTQAAFATDGRRSHPVRSKAFRHLLVNEYRKATAGKVPNAEALAAALNAVEAAAVHDGPELPAHARVAGHGGRVYLHLADAESTVVEVDAAGWRVCPRPPVRFRRPAGMLALPAPRRGGSLSALRRFLNVPDDPTFALVVGWLAGCFRPDGPFPVMALLGEQGSAKTTTARVLKRLIDPAAAAVRSEPREARDLMIQGRNNWVLAFDNLSGLPGWLSDAFCRLATGGGFSTRELYTNDDEVIFDAKRPLVVNGIEDFVTRADLLERSLLVRHPPIPEEDRRPESEFWAEFDAAHPLLLGSVLDRVSAGLRELPRVRLGRLPRMADFALFAVACERGAGEWGGEGDSPFLAAYAENQAGAHEQALDASPVPAAVLAAMDGKETWEGTPAELLAELDRHAPNPQPKDWPRKPNALTNRLRRLAPDLRRVHRLDFADGRLPGGKSAGKRTRFVRITRLHEPARGGPSPPSPSSPPDGPGSEGVGEPSHPTGDGSGGRCPTDRPGTVPADRPRDDGCGCGEERHPEATGDGGDGPPRPPSGRRRFRSDDRPHESRA